MTQNIRSRSIARARRLQNEASNCVAIAVGKTGGFTADLIDEAVRLNARARELATPQKNGVSVREAADAD